MTAVRRERHHEQIPVEFVAVAGRQSFEGEDAREAKVSDVPPAPKVALLRGIDSCVG